MFQQFKDYNLLDLSAILHLWAKQNRQFAYLVSRTIEQVEISRRECCHLTDLSALLRKSFYKFMVGPHI